MNPQLRNLINPQSKIPKYLEDEVANEQENGEETIETLEKCIHDNELFLNEFLTSSRRCLAIGVSLLIVGMALLAIFENDIFENFHWNITDYRWRIFILWFFLFAIAGTIYYFTVSVRKRDYRKFIKGFTEKLYLKRQSTLEGQRLFLKEELAKLTIRTARVFFGNQERYEQASQWRKEAGDLLDNNETATSEIKFLLSSIDELVLREKKEQQEQRVWQYAAIGIIVVYLVGLVIAVLKVDKGLEIPIYDIPISIVLWGALGSLAAILYKFYTEQNRIHLEYEVRWLIARPVIGIIMGAVTYFALRSGLILLGATPSSIKDSNAIYSIISFLAGFSDKFYIGIINLLVEKTFMVTEQQKDEVTQEQAKK